MPDAEKMEQPYTSIIIPVSYTHLDVYKRQFKIDIVKGKDDDEVYTKVYIPMADFFASQSIKMCIRDSCQQFFL